MRYRRVYIESLGYELPPQVVTSAALEQRLEPAYAALRFKPGQLEALTGVRERRYWEPGQTMFDGALRAARKALSASAAAAADIGMLIYAGVCRDQLEPATACAVADGLGLGPDTHIYDVSNACLGVLNGTIHVANAIELGQVRAGLVVSCESARPIVDSTIGRLLENPTLENFRLSLATLTGGSGAAAVLVVDESLALRRAGTPAPPHDLRAGTPAPPHRLLGGVIRGNARHHELCRWGPDGGIAAGGPQVMRTDSVGVLQHGVALGIETWRVFLRELEWDDGAPDKDGGSLGGDGGGPDKIICHQVGSAHQQAILKSLGLPPERDFTTFEHLGNIGTVSLPLTLAMAAQRGFLKAGERVGLLGIGSGLNCLMLGVQW